VKCHVGNLASVPDVTHVTYWSGRASNQNHRRIPTFSVDTAKLTNSRVHDVKGIFKICVFSACNVNIDAGDGENDQRC